MAGCEAELCSYWTGQGCVCEVMGIDPTECKCGHPKAAHEAEECWTRADASDHPASPCTCGWYRPMGGTP